MKKVICKVGKVESLAMLFSLGLFLCNSYAESYPKPDYKGPASNPDLSGFSTFTPPVSDAAPVPGAPVIAQWTRQNQSGDTMALTGENLSLYSTPGEEGKDSQFVFYGQGTNGVNGLIRRLDGRQCALTLPASLPVDKMYLLWPHNENGYGKPVAINKTEAWWVGSDQVAVGESFSVYGRNLQLGSGDCHIYIQELDRWIDSSAASSYKADFILPSGIGNGSYTIWVHNGNGGRYGWAKPMSLVVVSKVNWTGPTYNVKDYGATGDGVTDDFNAISAAISAAASKPYSTVYFPPGTYAIAGRMPMKYKSKIRYMGAGMDQTTITLHPNHATSASPNFLVYNASDNSEYRDLTLQANAYGGDNIFYIRGQHHVTCENVRFSQLASPSTDIITGVVDIHQTTHVTFKNCEFMLTGRLFLGGADQAVVDGCDFYGLNDNNLLINSYGAHEISILNCTAQSYDNSDPTDGFGWCKGRVFHSDGAWGATRRIYFGGNTTIDMTPRYDPSLDWYEAGQVDQNSGENFMCENENVLWRASPVATTSSSITLPGIASSYVGDIVAIVSGKGFGQSREIVSVNATTGEAAVDEPWNVVPDQNSVASIGTFTRQMIVHGNYFDGTPRAISDTVNNRNIAVAGVEPYGGAMDWIVADNTFHQMRGGLALFSRYKDNVQNTTDYCVMPHYFNTYMNNSFVSCRNAIGFTVDKRAQGSGSLVDDVATFGNVFRGNQMTNTVSQAIRANTLSSTAEIAMSIFDRNTVHSLGSFVSGDDGQKNHVWLKNKFYGNNSSVGLLIAATDRPVLKDNEFYNFKNKYGGSLPGAILEVPERVVRLTGASLNRTIDICNSGTATLDWEATADSEWIDLTQVNSSVSDETSVGTLAIEIDAATAPSNETEAVITVKDESGEQVQKLTVVYDAAATDPPPPPDGPPTPVLVSIAVSGPADVNEESTAQYVCTATYSDATTAVVDADWNENSGYASINASGLLTTVNVNYDQTVKITATFGGLSVTQTVILHYVAPTLASVTISGPVTVDEESTAQYTCTANWSDGTTTSVEPDWSENSSYTTISSSGLLSAGNVTADQNVTVSASYGGVTDTHTVVIKYAAPALVGISISGPGIVNEETTAQYVCTASYSDGTSQVISPAWSENSSYATINASGLFTAGNVTSDQSVLITAAFGGLSDTHTVSIQYIAPTLTGITISGPTSINEEASAQYNCTANYSDGTSQAVSPTWSENKSFTTISGSGLLSAGNVTADQNVTVSASYGGKSDTQVVSIKYVAPTLTGIAIGGPTSLNEETTAQYSCTASYSDGTSETVAPVWSENSSHTSISASGLLSAGNVTADQNVTVSASYGGKSDTQVVSINYIAPSLTGIVISGPANVDEQTTAQYSCTANYSDGTSEAVAPTWSEDSSHASISASGLLSAGNITTDQSLTITASFGGKSDSYGVTILYVVPPVVLTGISIAGPASMNENTNVTYTCTAAYSDGTFVSVNPTWSENVDFATINSSGVISVGNIDDDSSLALTASYQGFTATKVVSIWTVGTRVVYPLSGFSGKLVRAQLWDDAAQSLIPLGEMDSPDELVLTDMNANQWYWMLVEEYDESAGNWVRVHENWINM